MAPAAYCLECLYVAPRSLLTPPPCSNSRATQLLIRSTALVRKRRRKKETDEEQEEEEEEERDGFQRAPCRRLVNSLSLSLLLSSRQKRQQ